MTSFLAFALYLCFGVTFLIVYPVIMHSTLPPLRKWLLSVGAFVVLFPLALALYVWLGVPQLAQ